MPDLAIGSQRVAFFLGSASPQVERFDGYGVVCGPGKTGVVSEPGNRFGAGPWAIADDAVPDGFGTSVQQAGRGSHHNLFNGSRVTPVVAGHD